MWPQFKVLPYARFFRSSPIMATWYDLCRKKPIYSPYHTSNPLRDLPVWSSSLAPHGFDPSTLITMVLLIDSGNALLGNSCQDVSDRAVSSIWLSEW